MSAAGTSEPQASGERRGGERHGGACGAGGASGGGARLCRREARPLATSAAPCLDPNFFLFFVLCIQFFFKKILAEFFYLDVHFLFLPFDKFLSVKIFLVIFFISPNCFFKFFLPTKFSIKKLFDS